MSAFQHKKAWHILTNNNNAALKHYYFDDKELILREELSFPLNKILESVSVFVAEERLMVFAGGVDQKIHYY